MTEQKRFSCYFVFFVGPQKDMTLIRADFDINQNGVTEKML